MGGGLSKSEIESTVDAKLRNYAVRDELSKYISKDDVSQKLTSKINPDNTLITKQDVETQMKSRSLWCSPDGSICSVPVGFTHLIVSTPPNMTTNVYSDSEGTYIASASSQRLNTTQAFQAFNDTLSTWESALVYASDLYNGSRSTTVDGTDYAGEWLQIQLPYSLLLTEFTLRFGRSDTRMARSFILAGSTDGDNWTKLFQMNDLNESSPPSLSHPWSASVKNTQPFSHFRIIVLQTKNSSTSSMDLAIRRLSFRGLKR
jgi:hypothetical protein